MNKDFEIFKAVYFSELETLKKLLLNPKDLVIKIPFPENENDYKLYWEAEHIEINILDILNWTNYAFYEYFEVEKTGYKCVSADSTVYEVTFNPSIHYKNTIECLEWVCSTFAIDNYYLTDYSKFRLLRHFIFDGDYWFAQYEIDEALESGFKQIDLDLINQAELGNSIKVYQLTLEGANPNIDPIDFSDESCIYHILDSDFQYHKMMTKKLIGERQFFETENCYKMLESLYQAGVSNYILDIIHYNKLV